MLYQGGGWSSEQKFFFKKMKKCDLLCMCVGAGSVGEEGQWKPGHIMIIKPR